MATVQVNFAKTPSPPPRVRTPQTPKFGAFGDNWEPYSPRKSARIANRTPSPQSSTNTASRSTTSRKPAFSTPVGSPHKKRAPAMDSVIRAARANSLMASGITNPTESFSIGSSKSQQKSSRSMLPTPAKTPCKQSDEKLKAGVCAVARNLFAAEASTPEVAPSPRKKAKTYTGVSLESFRAEEAEEDIEIFTDSRDRLPHVDESAENPFYTNTAGSSQPTVRRSTRTKKVLIPGRGRVSVDEAVQRGDGIVYVFRGKSFWKPREDGNRGEDSDSLGEELEADGPILASPSAHRSGSPPRRTTRSSIKPRLLFPSQEKQKLHHNTDDEEAATDIEDHVLIADAEEEEPQIKTPLEKPVPDTPSAPRFAPASPPTTARATRVSERLIVDETPAKRTGRSSPFDTWRRSKTGTASRGQKREAESSLPDEGALKRPRA